MFPLALLLSLFFSETYTLEMSPISVDIGHNVLPTPIIVWNEPLPNEDAGRGTQLEADNNPSEGKQLGTYTFSIHLFYL